MSRGALCSYGFLTTIVAGTQSIVVSMDAFIGVPVPPQSGYLRRVTVKSVDAVLTGGAYDVTIWSTDSAVPLNRAMFEVFRRTAIAAAGGAASARVDLNESVEDPYVMQGGAHTPDMQIEIDTGANEAADRDFRVELEFEGASSPSSPVMSIARAFDNNPF